MKPKVSFIIAAYNEELYIQECIDSCLAQVVDADIEICITDDGSTDNTFKMLENYSSSDVLIHRFKENKGKVSAFNHSFKMSSGDYIALMGGDDVNHHDRISKQLSYIVENSLDLTWGDMTIIDGSGKSMPNFDIPIKDQPIKKDIVQDNFIPGSTIFMTRKMAEIVFPITPSLKFEDWWIGFFGIFRFKSSKVLSPIIDYRIHDNNTVGSGKDGYLSLRRKNISRHLDYHNEFDRHLRQWSEDKRFLKLNRLTYLYKQACLSDSFFIRLTLWIRSWSLVIGSSGTRVFLKFIFVTFFGLKGVEHLYQLRGK